MLPSLAQLELVKKKIKKVPNRQGEYKRKIHYCCYLLCSQSGLRISEAIKFDLTKKDKNGLYRINKPKGKKERAFTTYHAESGLPLPLLQKQLGHRSIRTTALYWHNIYQEPFAGKMPIEDKKEPPKSPSIENFPLKTPEPAIVGDKPIISSKETSQPNNFLLISPHKKSLAIANYQPGKLTNETKLLEAQMPQSIAIGQISPKIQGEFSLNSIKQKTDQLENSQLLTITANNERKPTEKELILSARIKELEEQLAQVQAENNHLKVENKHLKALIQQFPETETKIIQPLPDNNNIATVIVYYGGYYRVFLLVYDPVYSTANPVVFPERELASNYGKYSDNPILLIHPYCDCSRSFSDFVTSPYVTKNYSSSYLKPFDVAKTYTTRLGFGFYHEGVYLGKIDGEFKVCHFTSKNNDTTIDQNCEHFANMVVYGINFSEQIEKNKGKFVAGAATTATVGMGGIAGMGFFNLIGSIALAPATGGASLLIGAGSTLLSGVGVAATAELCDRIDDSKANEGRSSVNLRNEIRDTDNRLGKKSD
ncbi:7301_t:CDS:2 [Gigaspora margarita]|uniref:7301_t:CDS:1 n=1 Tax=Gigaspora margarita TaxID=4874 RepID=A0ABN7VF65_GIGMA|nr:7301_t:CDS:2 [Gigaspora margarita]